MVVKNMIVGYVSKIVEKKDVWVKKDDWRFVFLFFLLSHSCVK
jgi:hypothetical protein